MTTQIFHNPSCSKSRQTLQILEDKGIEAEQVLYLKTPPNKAELLKILNLLKINDPRVLMRQGEAEYTTLKLADENLSKDDLIQAMLDNPKLIERPIVIHNGQARIGRPPESILEIL